MTSPGCTTEQCTYAGPESKATSGRCTKTAGYISNAEIQDILAKNPTARQIPDPSDIADILVYDSVQRVSYMSDESKKKREHLYRMLNFGGTSDWAISLDDSDLVPEGLEIGANETFPSPQFAVVIKLHSSCKPYKDILWETWKDAGELAAAPMEWSRKNKYQRAMNLYIGKKSTQVPVFC